MRFKSATIMAIAWKPNFKIKPARSLSSTRLHPATGRRLSRFPKSATMTVATVDRRDSAAMHSGERGADTAVGGRESAEDQGRLAGAISHAGFAGGESADGGACGIGCGSDGGGWL